MTMIVDFHSHTLASDGVLTTAQLLEKFRAASVEICAITDHDSVAAFETIDFDSRDPRVVLGVELNTTYERGDVHILGYAFDKPHVLHTALARHRQARIERVREMCKKLTAAGFPTAFETVEGLAAPNASLGRPHVAKALLGAGHITDMEDAFRGLLGRDGPGFVASDHLSPQSAILLILEAGGIPVLAHPGRLRDEAAIPDMIAAGIRGIEVFYPMHDQPARDRYRDIALHHNLVMTAGSDFHDEQFRTKHVGMHVAREDITPFLELIGVN